MDNFSLQCFLLLKEQLNFTRTAKAMGISQPTLSRIIAGLEQETGVPLFKRSKHGICLTMAGQEFAACAREIVREYESAFSRARSAGAGRAGALTVQFLPAMNTLVAPAVRKMNREHPGIILTVAPQTQERIVLSLREGSLDAGLIMDSGSALPGGCQKEQFYQDRYCVALHCDHPLAAREFLRLSELTDERWLFYRRKPDNMRGPPGGDSDHPIIADQFESFSNFPLRGIRRIDDLLGLLSQLDCQEGVAILPLHLEPMCPPSIRFVPLLPDSGEQEVSFSGIACWREDNDNPALPLFRKILAEVNQSHSR